MDVLDKINKAKSIWVILLTLTENDLERAISTAADVYHNIGTSPISDEVYDILKERLRILNPGSKIFKQVGAPIKGSKIELPYWMGSMDKIKSEDHLIKRWANTYKGPYVVSDKLDGVSCLLVFEDKKITLYTRGDGRYGQNISFLADMVNMSTDLLAQQNMKIAVRGELIMSKKNFEKYEKMFSGARSMVAGLINSKPESVNEGHARDIDFVTYEVIEPLAKPSYQLKLLKEWGLNVVYYDIYEQIDPIILEDIRRKRKKKSIYKVDGIIITDNIKHPRNKSGNPPYSFAYKGISGTANVRVTEVVWHASKDGIIVPRVHYEKVRLSQANLESTQGFNAQYIVENKIGPGAIITIVRSGEVIPHILGVVAPAKKAALPKDMEYYWDKNGINIILKDADKNVEVIIRRLTKFVEDIGVDNISEGIIARLVAAGYDTIPKLISLTVGDFLEVEGFGKRLAEKLYHNLQIALANLDLLTLMVASNVFGRGFGEKKIKKVLDNYPAIVYKYREREREKWETALMSLEGFSTITVNAFLNALPDFQEFYNKINKMVDVKPYEKKIKKGGLFENEIVVFTGFRNKEWEKFIEEEGGKIIGSVSRNVTLLIFNDGEEMSTKYKKAKGLGIRTIPKSGFAKKYNL